MSKSVFYFFSNINNIDHSNWPPIEAGTFISVKYGMYTDGFLNDVSLFKRHLDEVHIVQID